MLELKELAIGVGVAAIIIAIVLNILVQSSSTFTANSAAANATNAATTAIATIPNWFAIVIIVVIGAMLIRYFGVFGGGGERAA
jgi:ABC-type dipeptide/oligopeptide/nickel transport system permease component